MNEDSKPRGNEGGADDYLQQTKSSFARSVTRGLYLPQAEHPTGQVDVHIDAKLENPIVPRERSLGSFQGGVANFLSGTAVLISFLTLVGLIFTVKFAFEQWQTMNRTYEEIRRQTADTDKLAKQAERQSSVARGTFAILKKEFEIEERPYLSVKVISLDPITGKPEPPEVEFEAGKPIYVNIAFKNIGKGQAVGIVIHKHLLFGQSISRLKAEPPDYDRNGFTLENGIEQYATTMSLIDTYGNETSNFPKRDQVAWDGSVPIVVFGRISYKDIFGTQYCKPYMVQKVRANWAYILQMNKIKVEELCPLAPKRAVEVQH